MKVLHLVRSNDDFIVCVDPSYDVDWETSEKYDAKGHEDEGKFNDIIKTAARIESIPCQHLSESVRLSFKRMLGESIAFAIDHDYKNAAEGLKHAEEFVSARNFEQSRVWYLSASGKTTFGVVIGGVIFWLSRNYLLPSFGEPAFYVTLSAAAGSLGALLSIAMRMGNTELDCAAGERLHYLEGFYRIISGMISAAFVSLCVYTGVVVPIFSKLEKTHAAMVLAGLVAGACERFAPSLINQFGNRAAKGNSGNRRGRAQGDANET